jgi:hypothetical protein
VSTISYTLFVPSGDEPAAAWPVAIFGHGFTDSKQGAPWAVASTLARSGFATIAINVVGHGGGAGGNLTIVTPAGPTMIPDGGRGIDQDGNGTIGSTEGVDAAPPDTLVSNRDGLRQTVVDLMQLVREIQVGFDMDADGPADLGRVANLPRRPILRRDLRRGLLGARARPRCRRAERAGRADHRDRAAVAGLPA